MTLSKDDFEKMVTTQALAEQFGVHRSTITRLAKSNNIGRMLGNQRVFLPSDIQKLRKICRFTKGNPTFSKK